MVNYAIASSLTFRIAAVIISFTCIFYMLVMTSERKLRSRLYLNMVFIVAINSITGIISRLMDVSPFGHNVKYVVIYVSRLIYYSTHFALAPVFLFYILLVAGTYYRYSASTKILLLSPIVGLEFATILNPITKFTFTLDENLVLHRQQGVYIAYVISGIYIAYCIFLLAQCWKTLHGVKLTAMLYFLVLVVGGVAIQMVYPDLVIELMCEAVGLMGMMILLEDESGRQDTLTRTLNRSALLEDLRDYFLLKRSFRSVCVRIANPEVYRKIMGYAAYDALEGEIGDYLVSSFTKYQVYRAGLDSFFVICPDTDRSTAQTIADAIRKRFTDDWVIGTERYSVAAVILIGLAPQQFERVDDVFMLCDSALDRSETTVFNEMELDFLFRRSKVEKAISRGMEESGFSVVYNMIYDMDGTTLKGAMAQLRLNDRELGEIEEEEFLAVAAQAGVLSKLEKIVIEAGCETAHHLAEQGNEPDFLILPIMGGQILSSDIVETVGGFIQKYEVDRKVLAFDVSKVLATGAQELIDYLKRNYQYNGVGIFLRDNENDFLRILSRSEGQFDGALINLHPLLDEGNRKEAEIILATRINLLNELGKKIVICGVDTEADYELAATFRVDYVSGKYFSEAQTRNQLENQFAKTLETDAGTE